MINRFHSLCLVCLVWCALMLASHSVVAASPISRLPQGRSPSLISTLPSPNPQAPATTPAPITNNQSPITPSLPPTSFDRYAVITTRMPFGDEATAAALAAAAATANQPAAESFTKTLKMCAITRNRNNGKVQVGLVNNTTKKNYFLYEGDAEDGIELLKADYENEKALLRKGAEEAWLDMKTVTVAAAPAVAPAAGVRRGMMPAPPAPAPAVPEEPAKPRLTGEALKAHLQNYQMDLIRAGGRKGPPLPMQLTPEMDAKLVEEGVLPSPE